ncbi:MAG: hypothetical protein LUP99_03720 [Methanomicrobiales archaeon]|nr:hypothetical protein [Methanomicrobiales archaeon]
MATIFDQEDHVLTDWFERTQKDLLRLKDWIMENKCDIVARESSIPTVAG